ncbi:MAG: hypothetical protein ACI4JS_00565 [Oscillospiraceae bacterium]
MKRLTWFKTRFSFRSPEGFAFAENSDIKSIVRTWRVFQPHFE